jgi:cAMP-binding proteins - catabolite gene activator and regulatory subunit of cAMP-dependent protein kinases
MVNLEKIKTLYKLGKDLSLKDIQMLISAATSESYDQSEYLIEEGSMKKELFFISKGLVRVFQVNKKGEEITIRIILENHPVASSDIILFNQPSKFYFQAIEPTTVMKMDYDQLQTIIEKNPKLERSRHKILLGMLKDAAERIESLVLFSPEERYLEFLKKHPEITNRVPDKYIANILGITPVSLSRIRKRIAEKRGKL